jgi:hypothetical protein
MTLGQLAVINDVALPLVEKATNILGRLISSGIDAAGAMAELKGLVAVTSDRISKAELGFKSRDAEHDARVALLTTEDKT